MYIFISTTRNDVITLEAVHLNSRNDGRILIAKNKKAVSRVCDVARHV